MPTGRIFCAGGVVSTRCTTNLSVSSTQCDPFHERALTMQRLKNSVSPIPSTPAAPIGRWLSVGASVMCVSFSASAHTWTLNQPATSVSLRSLAFTDCVPGVCGPIDGGMISLDPGIWGDDVTYYSEAFCKLGVTASCGCKAHGWSYIGIRGRNTPTLRIH